MSLYRRFGKRLLDVALSATALLALLPFLPVLALLVRRYLGSPVLYAQQRAGRGGRPFTLRKFRTMTNAVDAEGRLLPDEERLTRFGAFLRSSSLDELPELWNVLKGEMSLVGPRPLLLQYVERYSPEQARRLDVPPGLSGWAQVNGRNASTWEERFEQDGWYVQHLSLLLDLKIMWLTARKVVVREGITHEGHATMPEFFGSRQSGGEPGAELRGSQETPHHAG